MKKRLRILSILLCAVLCAGLFHPAGGRAEDAVPNDATAAFPAAAARQVYVENPDAKRICFRNEAAGYRLEAYAVNDGTAHLRLALPASDDPCAMVLHDVNADRFHELPALLDAEGRRYALDLPLPGPGAAAHLVELRLYERLKPESPDVLAVYLIPGEEYLPELCAALLPLGWVPDGENADAPAQAAPNAYVLHAVDQYGAPVPGLYVNFCTDTACTLAVSDLSGTVTFDGPPDVYHVQLLKAPAGYSFDSGLELYTGREYGEWRLRIRKD